MGALHEGHVSLIRASAENNDITVCSIFVNPTQFNDPSDLKKYPRTIAEDIDKLYASGCDFLFFPEVSEMYGEAGVFKAENWNLGDITKVLEGVHRPGHFNGVASIVKRLLQVVNPDNVYFGQKDYQQCLIVKELIHQLNIPVTMHICPTVREPDGLAMSSRNVHLTEADRNSAIKLSRTLEDIRTTFINGELEIEKLKEDGKMLIQADPNISLEYLEIVDGHSLGQIKDPSVHEKIIVCIAAKVGKVRLIDNIILKD